MTKIRLEDVFGVSNKQVLSYLPRDQVDGYFVDTGLKSDKQIVVYGSSKQGKTSLVEKHLPYSQNIVVRCTPPTDVLDIYRSILRQLGIDLESESEVSGKTSGSTKVGSLLSGLNQRLSTI